MLPLLLAIVAQSNPVWAERVTDAGLILAERQCFAAVITSRWSDATPAAVDYLHCYRDVLAVCHYTETVSGTAAQFASDETADLVPRPNAVTWNANVATYQRTRSGALNAAQTGELAACIAIVWPAAGAPQSLTIERVGSTYPASLDHHVTGTAAQYVAARAAGTVVRRVR